MMNDTDMTKKIKNFDYDEMVQEGLRSVVRDILRKVAKEGLPGSHHFYVTFQTNRPDVTIPDYLLEKHPEEVTVVLQHQFWDLKVHDKFFEVALSFNDMQETIKVPFATIISFLDPSVKFGLQFVPGEVETSQKDEKSGAASKKASSGTNNVVAIDAFRKK